MNEQDTPPRTIDRCPQCSEPLEGGIGACPNCGWLPPTGPAGGPEATGTGQPPAWQEVANEELPPGTQVSAGNGVITFSPPPGAMGGAPAAAGDPRPFVRVAVYILVCIIVNALMFMAIALDTIYLEEPVAMEGPDNTTYYQLERQGLEPLSVAGAAYSGFILALNPVLIYGIVRGRRWVLRPAVIGGVLGVGMFPIGTLMGPVVSYLMSRPVVQQGLGTPVPPADQGSPYGLEGAPPISPR